MKRIMTIGFVLATLLLAPAGCHMPPGQVQKHTGYNPASGKYHAKKHHKTPPGHARRAAAVDSSDQ